MSRSKQMRNRKVKTAYALKATGQAQDSAPVLKTTELLQTMTDSCVSRLNDLGNGQN